MRLEIFLKSKTLAFTTNKLSILTLKIMIQALLYRWELSITLLRTFNQFLFTIFNVLEILWKLYMFLIKITLLITTFHHYFISYLHQKFNHWFCNIIVLAVFAFFSPVYNRLILIAIFAVNSYFTFITYWWYVCKF